MYTCINTPEENHMLLNELHTYSLIESVKERLVQVQLDESITDYFAVQISKLKNKSEDELFDGPNKIDLEELAKVITALKVLSNKEYRSVMTHEDIGIKPTSAKDLFKFLNSVDKGGKSSKDVESTFNALKQLAPSTYRKELDALGKLKGGDAAKKAEAIKNVVDLSRRVGEMFTKLRDLASGQATAAQTTELTKKMAKA